MHGVSAGYSQSCNKKHHNKFEFRSCHCELQLELYCKRSDYINELVDIECASWSGGQQQFDHFCRALNVVSGTSAHQRRLILLRNAHIVRQSGVHANESDQPCRAKSDRFCT